MSAQNIKAGSAYVEIATKDGTKPGLDKVEQNFSALSRSIRRQNDLTTATTAAAAAKSASKTVQNLQTQKKAVEQEIKAVKPAVTAQNGAVNAVAGQKLLELTKQRQQLEQQIEAGLRQQAALEQQAAKAMDQADQLAQRRLQLAQRHTVELQKQQATNAGQRQAGAGAVSGTLASAAQSHRIANISTVGEADRMAASLRTQHGLANQQAQALMDQLRTMRQQGASAEAQKVVADAVRQSVAQRRDLEQQINDIQNRRTQIKEAPAQARQNWNAGQSATNTQGLSPETLKAYPKWIKNIDVSQMGAARSSGILARALGGVSGAGSRNQMILQGMIYAADDAASSFGTGGLAGALRGAANNISYVAAMFGPWAFGLTVAATAALQLYFAFNKTAKSGQAMKESVADISTELAEFNQQAAHAVELKKALSAEETGKMASGLKEDLDKSKMVEANLRKMLADASAEEAKTGHAKTRIEGQQSWANFGTDPTGQLEGATAAHKSAEERRAKIQEELNKHLREQGQLQEQHSKTLEKHKRLYDAERGRKNFIAQQTRELNEQARALKKRNELYEMETKYRAELTARMREYVFDIRKEADAHGSNRTAILQELVERKRMAMLAENPAEALQLVNAAAAKKLRENDRNDPFRVMQDQLLQQVQPLQAQRRTAIQEAQNKLAELNEMSALNPERAKEIAQLRQGVFSGLANTLRQMEPALQSQANTATEARSTEGIRAILAATSRVGKTPEQEMLEQLAAGNKMTREQLDLWNEYIKKNQQAPRLVVKKTH